MIYYRRRANGPHTFIVELRVWLIPVYAGESNATIAAKRFELCCVCAILMAAHVGSCCACTAGWMHNSSQASR